MLVEYNLRVLKALEKYAGCSYAEAIRFDEKMEEMEKEVGMRMVFDGRGALTGLLFNDEKKYVEFVLRWY